MMAKEAISADKFKVENLPEQRTVTVNKKNKGAPPNSVRIVAYDGDIGGMREIGDFYAFRWVNPLDKTTYLKNDSLDFLIPMPDSERENGKYDIITILNKLADIEDKIKAELEEDDPDINQKDYFDERQCLLKELRVLLYSTNSGFWFMTKEIPTLKVWRKGNTWHPLKFDLNVNTVYVPSNTRLADTRNSESNKRTKYGSLASLTTVMLLLFVFSFLLFGFNSWTWWKAYTTMDESTNMQNIAELVNTCTTEIHANNEEVKKGVIEGVSEALINNEINTRPVGSGG